MSHTDYNNIKVIGFDLDQTLYPKSPEIDSAIRGYIYQQISEKLNIDIALAKEKFDNLYDNGIFPGVSSTLMHLGFEHTRAKDITQEALEKADIAKYLNPDLEVVKLLEDIQKKYKNIDLITGSNKNTSIKKLEHLQIPLDLFSNIITADEGSKSNNSAFHFWLSKYPNYIPEKFLYIGDRISSDYEKPKELGIKSILVNIAKPDETVDCLQLASLFEIKDYLKI